MSFLDAVNALNGAGGTTQPQRPLAAPATLQDLEGAKPYALTAMAEECQRVATAPEGTRNHALNTAAFNLAQLVAGGELPGPVVVEELTMAARAAGLEESEITATLRSGLRSGEQKPRTAPTDPTSEWLGTLPVSAPIFDIPTPEEGTQQWPHAATAEEPATSGTTSAKTGPTPPPSATPAGDGEKPPTTEVSPQPGGTPPTDADREAARQAYHNRELALEVERLSIREEAQRVINQRRNVENRPEIINLSDFLAREYPPTRYRMNQLWPVGGRVILAAQYKAGKSTAVGNALRSLVDGDDFLGMFETERVGRVVVIDNELNESTLQAWLADQSIQNTGAVTLIPLRGKVSSFDIMDPAVRQQWSAALKGVGADVVVLDCLRPVLDALGLSEDKDAGKFLVAFDTMLSEAGAGEAMVVHHMGHNGERSRGDSRILDWPDATWRMIRQTPEDPTSPRFFSAFGRDVNVEEAMLNYDGVNRHLTLVGGNRRETSAEGLVQSVIDFVALHTQVDPGGLSQRSIEQGLGGDSKQVRTAISLAVDRGLLVKTARTGRGGGFAFILPLPGKPVEAPPPWDTSQWPLDPPTGLPET